MSRFKACTKCGQQKSAVDFYAKHAACKECTKARVRCHYAANREKLSEYERERSQRPERKAWALANQRKMRARHPEKYKARRAVGNAVRDGRLKRMPCESCGSLRVQAHHEDYSRPLDVKWLCFSCHRAEHGQEVTRPEDARSGLAEAAE